ncbi:MAG: hypothetical protein SF162_11585 [bacterium]|nr:hypothetical protein [bacterium]
MAISEPRFNQHSMCVSAHGHIEKSEVELAFVLAQQEARANGTPMIVIVDANAADFLTAGARMAFLEAAALPCIRAILFVAEPTLLQQALRSIQVLDLYGKIQVYTSAADAKAALATT